MKQLPDAGAAALLLILALALWHLYQTENLRARIAGLEREQESVQIAFHEANPEVES
jgi:hypothetical protein